MENDRAPAGDGADDHEGRRGRHGDGTEDTAAASLSLWQEEENEDDYAHQNAWYLDDDDSSSSCSSSSSLVPLAAATNTSTIAVEQGQSSSLQEPNGNMSRQGGKKKNTTDVDDDDDDFPRNDGIFCHAPPPRNSAGAATSNLQKMHPHLPQNVNNSININNASTAHSSNMKVYYGDSDDPTSSDDDDNDDDEGSDDVSMYGDDGDYDCFSMYRTTTAKSGRAASSKNNNNNNNKSRSIGRRPNPKVEEQRQQQWEAMALQLQQFQREHGHCNVPSTYAPNPRLANFVSNQRTAYMYRQKGITKPGTRRITLDRIQKLEKMGFVWQGRGNTAASTTAAQQQEEDDDDDDDNTEHEQENDAAEAEEISQEDDDDDDKNSRQGEQEHISEVQGAEFSTTASNRRHRGTATTTTSTTACKSNNNNKRNNSSRRRPQSVSSTVNPSVQEQQRQQNWEAMMQQLVQFQSEHGHCNVPYQYRPNQRLSTWLENQKKNYSRLQRGVDKIGARLTHERIGRLTQMGVRWSLTTATATAQQQQEEDEDVDRMSQEEEDDKGDGFVVESSSRQGAEHGVRAVQGERITGNHHRRTARTMTTTRPANVAPPTAVQEPSVQQQKQNQRWEAMFSRLMEFKQRYGHTVVPQKMPELGSWINNQRSAFRRKQLGTEHIHSYRLTPEHLERLNAIGMVWDAREFSAVSLVHNDNTPQGNGDDHDEVNQVDNGEMESQDENHESRSNENVSRNASNGTTMASSTAPPPKRRYKSASTKSKEQHNQSWDTMLELFVAYKNQHGHFEGMKQNKPKLEQWVRNQRSSYWRKQRGEERNRNYKAYCISEENIQRLSDLGFPWESTFHAQQPQEDGSMVTTTPMMDAATTTALQGEPRPHKRSVRKLVARKSSITGATSSCRQKYIVATPAYTTNPPDSEHIQQSPSKRTRLSYSAAAPGGAGTDHDEGAAVASRSDGHRKRMFRGGVSADSAEQLSSSMITLQASSETIHFEDIVGHITAKMQIEDILYSLDPSKESMIDDSHEHEFTYLPSQPTSILMHGPSGCGKTLLARGIADEAKAAFISIAPNDIQGDLKTAARSIFQRAQEHGSGHHESNCAVIFIDDIDDVSRDDNQGHVQNCSRGILQELFLQLDTIARQKQQNGAPSDAHVLIVAATNCLGACDSALVRRFGAHLQVGLPTEHDRKEMIARYVAAFDNAIAHDEIINLSKKTAGWSGLELKTLTLEAAKTPMREYLQAARMRREQLQETGGRLPVPKEGMASVEECSSSIPLRAVDLADLEKCYDARFDSAV